jgi:hypothetical protein
MVAAIALAIAMSGLRASDSTAGVNAQSIEVVGFNHVRSADARIRRLMAEGYSRSRTFATLVDAIDELPCVVYVAHIANLSQGMEAALLHRADGSRELPIMRVLVREGLSNTRGIAVLAHELQHVVEVAQAGAAAGGAAMQQLFGRIGAAQDGWRMFETQAAYRVTESVLDELRQNRPRSSHTIRVADVR